MQAPEQIVAPEEVPADTLRSTFHQAIQGKDLSFISLGEIRRQVSVKLGFGPDALDFRKKEFSKIAQDIVKELQKQLTPSQVPKTALEELVGKAEKKDAIQWVYLITISRVLHASVTEGQAYADLQSITRKTIAEAVLDSFNNPVAPGLAGGRPREANREQVVALLVVYREAHQDGTAHFHIAVKLQNKGRFSLAKRTLRERHSLPSHFSCSHTQLWSAIRYGFIETPAKPDVDDSPWLWTPSWTGFAKDQATVDLFALSQEPYHAELWRKKREAEDKEASKKKAKTKFGKFDLTSIIISKHLWSKDGLMAYAQDYGSYAMKEFVHNRIRTLQMDIEAAKEWDAARENAKFEAIDDWTLMCRCAEAGCPHGEGQCSYKKAAAEIFSANAASFTQRQLATALRDILCMGPKKTTRVPFLVGPSNSGKSTLLYFAFLIYYIYSGALQKKFP